MVVNTVVTLNLLIIVITNLVLILYYLNMTESMQSTTLNIDNDCQPSSLTLNKLLINLLFSFELVNKLYSH